MCEWFSVVCALIDDDICNRGGPAKCCGFIRRSADPAKPLFFTTSTFPSHPCLQTDKSIAWRIDTSSVVRTLIDNGKLANHIGTFLPTAVRKILNIEGDQKSILSSLSHHLNFNFTFWNANVGQHVQIMLKFAVLTANAWNNGRFWVWYC